jgi:hypothetical protein
MEAMRQREAAQPLSGDARIDDADLGGDRMGVKVGRGSENKVPFVATVKMHDTRPHRNRFDLLLCRTDCMGSQGLGSWHHSRI